MKRTEQLYPLSWQHHNGLMAVLLLKKGVQKKADVAVMKDFINSIRHEELDEHFEAEENTLSLFSNKYAPVKELYNRMQLEHQDIRLCYQELEQADYTTIEKFYTLLDQHIRFEERDFFPLLEKTLTPDELQAIGDKLQHLSHQSCARYPIKFWE